MPPAASSSLEPAPAAVVADVARALGAVPRLRGSGPDRAYWYGPAGTSCTWPQTMLAGPGSSWSGDGCGGPPSTGSASPPRWPGRRMGAGWPRRSSRAILRWGLVSSRPRSRSPGGSSPFLSPPAGVLDGGPTRIGPRRGRLRRAARLAASGVDVREFARVRRLALALPAERLAHGDFHPGNLLFDQATGAVLLTDFEFLGPAPAGSDLLQLWATLERNDDRALVLDALLAGTPPDQRRRVGLLHRWVALRTLAERLTARPAEREPDQINESRRLVVEARRHAASWDAI